MMQMILTSGYPDQSMVEDLPSDKAMQSRENFDQAMVEDVPSDKDMQARGDTDQSMAGAGTQHRGGTGMETDWHQQQRLGVRQESAAY